MALKNIIGQKTTTTGAIGVGATINIDGAAIEAHNTFADGGAVSGASYSVGIKDGDARQVGVATYTSGSPGTLTVNSVLASTNGGSAITLTGDAEVYVDALAEDIQQPPSEGAFVDGDKTKLDGIETGADVTDTANVTAAGALMDSEVDADIKTLSLPANTTISTFGASLIDDTTASAARTTLGLDSISTQAASNVNITGGSISGITDLAIADGGTGASTASAARTALGAAHTASPTFTGNVTVPEVTETVYSLTGTDVNPANGTVQTLALTANRTLTESLATGQAVRLLITGGDAYTVTWPAGIEWVDGAAPTLTAKDLVTLEKIGSDLIGYYGVGVA